MKHMYPLIWGGLLLCIPFLLPAQIEIDVFPGEVYPHPAYQEASLDPDASSDHAQLWLSSWLGEDASYGRSSSGRIPRLLVRDLRTYRVKTTSAPTIKPFASIQENGRDLVVYLFNQASTGQQVDLALVDYLPDGYASRSVFRGDAGQRSYAAYSDLPPLPLTEAALVVDLPPTSITVIRVPGRMKNCRRNAVKGGDFVGADLQHWDVDGGGHIDNTYAYRQGESGLVSGAKSRLSQLVRGLSPNTTYTLSALVQTFNEDGRRRPVRMGVCNYQRDLAHIGIASSRLGYFPYSVEFTTGPDETTATIFFESSGEGVVGMIDEVRVHCSLTPPLAPIKLTEYSGQEKDGGHLLHWTVEGGQQLVRYEIESSTDRKQWSPVATVAAGTQTGEMRDYAYHHPSREGKEVQYRLKMVGADGNFIYSPVLAVGSFDSRLHEVQLSATPVPGSPDWRTGTFLAKAAAGQ